MKHFLLAALLLLGFTFSANAATCFWVGGTGTWSTSNTASWASASGGTTGTCAAVGGVPKQSPDIATFDGASGGGTVTPNFNINLGSGQITWGAFTGTIDFSANNNTLTVATFSGTGSGTRVYNCGTGAITITATGGQAWNMGVVTGLTWNCSSSTINFNSPSSTFSGGGLSYNIVNIGSPTAGSTQTIAGANTFTTLGIAAPNFITFPAATTQTFTAAQTWTGAANSYIQLMSGTVSSSFTLSQTTGTTTCAWCAIRDSTGSGGASFTASNSFDLRHNSGWSISAPTGGGGGGFVGLIGGGI